MGDHTSDAEETRVTAPMQPFTTRQAMIGAVVLLIGLGITFGLPFLLG